VVCHVARAHSRGRGGYMRRGARLRLCCECYLELVDGDPRYADGTP
jgi:hypothetical protein